MKANLIAINASLALVFATGAYAQSSPAASDSSRQQASMEDKCDNMKGNAKDICKAQADGQKKISEAQAKVNARDTPKNRLELDQAKADAQYKVSKARCGDQVGDAKNTCEKEAKASHDLAIAQAKKQSQIQTSTGSSATGSAASGQPESSRGSTSGASSGSDSSGASMGGQGQSSGGMQESQGKSLTPEETKRLPQ